MHAIYCQTQNNTYTKINLSTVKWAQWDKTQSRELLGLFICVCSSLCTIVAHNTAQNRLENFPCYPPDNHHCSDDVYLREGGLHLDKTCVVPCTHSSFSDIGLHVCGTVYRRPCDKTLATNSLSVYWTLLIANHSKLWLFACMHHTNILHN